MGQIPRFTERISSYTLNCGLNCNANSFITRGLECLSRNKIFSFLWREKLKSDYYFGYSFFVIFAVVFTAKCFFTIHITSLPTKHYIMAVDSNSPKFSTKQYSNNSDVTGLIAISLKSLHVRPLEMQAFDVDNIAVTKTSFDLGLVYILELTEKNLSRINGSIG